jgi:four helix bundle protein
MLAHEKLDVYQCAVELLAQVTLLIDAMPPGSSVLRDQLERASLSVVANVAEAAGVRTPKERERHFGIARGSAMECGALLDACRLRRVCTVEQQQQAKHLLVRIVSMLTRLFTVQE